MSKPLRRIVTGHDTEGRAIIQSDAPAERVQRIGGDGPWFHEVWNTRATPAPIDRASGEPVGGGARSAAAEERHAHPGFGHPAGSREISTRSRRRKPRRILLRSVCNRHRPTARSRRAIPFMHKTQSIDYGIVLEGEITLIVDEGETIVAHRRHRRPARHQSRLGQPVRQELPNRLHPGGRHVRGRSRVIDQRLKQSRRGRIV